MAINVKFLKGTAAGYANLAIKDSNTFYYTGNDLYLGKIKLSNASDLAAVILRNLTITEKTNLVAAINELKTAIDNTLSAEL